MSCVLSHEAVIAELWSGMTLGIGGWGSRRKPMSLVQAIVDSSLEDLTVVSYGGPDVGMLCAAGKVRKLVFGFVSLDSIPLEPNFRRARQSGAIEVMELDEGMFLQGLRAAAWNLPFLPTRAGLGSDVLSTNPQLKTVRDPYGGSDVVAMPALHLDASIVHMNRADESGNAQYLGPDPYMDDWFCLAAKRAYVSCERLGLEPSSPHRLLLNSAMVHGVVVAPGGAGFTQCLPDYSRDEAAQRAYVKGVKR